MFELNKIYLGSALRIALGLGLALGIVSCLVFVFIFGINEYRYMDFSDLSMWGGFLSMMGFVFVASVVGWLLSTLVIVLVYNLIAREFGGVEIDLEKVEGGIVERQ